MVPTEFFDLWNTRKLESDVTKFLILEGSPNGLCDITFLFFSLPRSEKLVRTVVRCRFRWQEELYFLVFSYFQSSLNENKCSQLSVMGKPVCTMLKLLSSSLQPLPRTKHQNRVRGATDDETRNIKTHWCDHVYIDCFQSAIITCLTLNIIWGLCILRSFHLVAGWSVGAALLISFDEKAAIEVHSWQHWIWLFWEHLTSLFSPLLLLTCPSGEYHRKIHEMCISMHCPNVC